MADALFPYQVEGARWLADRRFALLADDPGLGKSAQSATACDILNARHVLVLGPAIARFTWEREFRKWSLFNRPACVVTSGSGLPPAPAALTTCSYDLAAEPHVRAWLCSVRWDVVILDEVHYLKSPFAKRTVSVFGDDGIVRRAARVWALSGTPAPNHAGELWVLLRVFGRTNLSHDAFLQRYCEGRWERGEYRVTGTRTECIPELRALLAPIMLRRRKADVMTQLPPLRFGTVIVEPGPVDLELEFTDYFIPGFEREAELRANIERQGRVIEDGMKLAGEANAGVRATLEFLKAMAGRESSGLWRRFVGLQKVEPVAQLVKEEFEIGAYEKLVIFAWHRGVIEGLRTRLAAYKPVTLYGGTDAEKRERNIQKFQRDPKCRLFIGNIQAAGTNITLTAASDVLVVEPDWVPGNNAQAIMRCHRIGQTRPVLARFVALAGGADERISNVLRRKTRELSALFDN